MLNETTAKELTVLRDVLRRATEYNQTQFTFMRKDETGRHCRTPACAWGHYVFAHIDKFNALKNTDYKSGDEYFEDPLSIDDKDQKIFFDVTDRDRTRLFGPDGMGGAGDNVNNAIEYLDVLLETQDFVETEHRIARRRAKSD